MPRIRQLPSSVITKIAAGEVIERPASVVKELLENSVDAGATRVEIDLEQGGAELIRVVDDGHGIEPDDLPLAFASHATSKLIDADDLFRVSSMGFRGEALASIGGVARVTLQSRAAGHDAGAEVVCNGGDLSEVRPWNGAPGTRIEARHLFFNTPVRRKFLKTHSTELNHVCETVHRLALANPVLHLVLRHNGRLVVEVPASAGLKDRIGLFFGGEVRDGLYPIEAEQGPVKLAGFVADPACERGNTKLQYLFVNGRWVRDRSLGHALQEAYRGLLMTGRYAVGFLFLKVPPDQVDVNVHPTKAEVRFRDGQALYHLVRGAVKARLNAQNLVPRLQVPREFPPPEAAPAPDAPSIFESPRHEIAAGTVAPWEAAAPARETPPAPVVQHPEPRAEGRARAIQIHDSYLVVETPDGMLVIDQHALHERILFEQLRRRVRAGQLEIQRLLIPEPVDLSAEQAACVLEAKEELRGLGLEVEDFGGGTVLLASYPALLSRVAPVEILKGVVDRLVERERAPSREQVVHDLLATMACRAAVKAGDPLTPDEIAYLMELRDLAEDSHHCPHGRPTSLTFSKHELEKQFRRV
jgi:DNA mismatch repair protein MutL